MFPTKPSTNTTKLPFDRMAAFELFKPLPYERHTRMIHPQFVTMNGKTYKEKPIAVTFIPRGNNRFTLKYPFCYPMNDRIKQMSAYKYHGFDAVPVKEWSVLNDWRTGFVTRFWEQSPDNPYDWYKQPITPAKLRRDDLKTAQIEMVNFILAKRYAFWACEMGLGKSLAAIHAAEMIQPIGDIIWVGPKAALAAVRLEFKKWETPLQAKFLTYQGLTKFAAEFDPDDTPPQIVVFDEGHNVKNGKAKCSQAAEWLVKEIKKFWGPDGLAIVMTGTPAAKTPVDWYFPVEILCPGFLAEGSTKDFRRRLSAFKEEGYGTGMQHDKTLAWLDDGRKCKICGQPPEDIGHPFDHDYVKSENEVAALRRRLMPITLVQLKKDYLDLPDMVYEVIELKPDPEMKRWASLIAARSNSAIQALMMLRELSDGFLYEQVEKGTKTCKVCNGSRLEVAWVKPQSDQSDQEISDVIECPECSGLDPDCVVCDGEGFIQSLDIQKAGDYERVERDCRTCKGTGQVPDYERVVREIRTPKEAAIKDQLTLNEETGRIVLFAAFQGSIDRTVRLCHKQGWDVIRLDGRGIIGMKSDGTTWDYEEPLVAFQNKAKGPEKLAAVGNSEAGGIGITLTAANTAVYVSNGYKATARNQSEGRIHRMGMDTNKGAKCVDLIHLPQDRAILQVLKSNKDLQKLSMIELERILKETDNV